jgi:hypothetical protein
MTLGNLHVMNRWLSALLSPEIVAPAAPIGLALGIVLSVVLGFVVGLIPEFGR